MKMIRSVLLLAAALLLVSCEQSVATVQVQFTKANGEKTPLVQVELAKTAGEQQRGLMYRRELAKDKGMLFIFGEESPRSFWMKNTYVELDIIFIGADKKIVSVAKRAVPLSETSRPSGKPASYVLEVVGGMYDEWKLAEGDTLDVIGDVGR